MLRKIMSWFCKHTRGHKYVKKWSRKKNGYVYECVRCGKPMEATKND